MHQDSPATALPDALTLGGAPNFRPIDTLQATCGRRLLPRRVFRSDALHRLSDAELERLAACGVDTVLDLRRPDERAQAPTRWHRAASPETVVFDATGQLDAVRPVNWRAQLEAPDFDAGAARRWMLDAYARMPAALAPAVGTAADRLLAAGGTASSGATGTGSRAGAILIHCTAGKDRTGFVCAMLLTALDVPHEAILADYLESRRRRPPAALARTLADLTGLEPTPRILAAIEVIAGVQAEFLETAFASARSRFGSIDAYLEAGCGLGAPRREALRDRLLR
jgi:protein-tyrosine phosphatase